MCERPCWPTPDEAAELIKAGYGDKLMLDFWVGEPTNYILCGANPGREGREASYVDFRSGCVFLDRKGLCQIHSLKPVEGRIAYHDREDDNEVHRQVASMWRTKKAQRIVAKWREKYAVEPLQEETCQKKLTNSLNILLHKVDKLLEDRQPKA